MDSGRGQGGWEIGRGGGRCTGGRSRGSGKWDSQGGGKREKKEIIMQHCAIFCNQKMEGTGIKGNGKREV